MYLEKLVEGRIYTDNKNLFKLSGNKLLINNKGDNDWIDATEVFNITELAKKTYREYTPIIFTDEEKELARCALKLGIKVIVKEDSGFYCSTDDEIWIGNFDSWENSSNIWFDECELPLLLKSSLAKRAKENKPLYLEDVVK